MPIIAWVLLAALVCCCLSTIGVAAAAAVQKSKKGVTKKKKMSVLPPVAPVAAEPEMIIEPLMAMSSPLVPLATTSSPIPSYSVVVAAPASYAAPVTYAAPAIFAAQPTYAAQTSYAMQPSYAPVVTSYMPAQPMGTAAYTVQPSMGYAIPGVY